MAKFAKCNKCEQLFDEVYLFHYEQFVDGQQVEVVLLCNDCLFDFLGKSYCDSDFL